MNIDTPLIALGCMRLPMRDKKIDMVELDKMVEYAISHGANYFDTAYMYVDGKSENAIGEVLKKDCPNDTQASFGLRWVAGKQRVFTILSGMSNLEQLKENVDTFVNYRPISEKEEKINSQRIIM